MDTQKYIQSLVDSNTKVSLQDFFKDIHMKFYPKYDISFMEYFLELTQNEGKFCVRHEKLIEYGIMTSTRSSAVKNKLTALGLVKEEYLLQDVLQNLPQGGRPNKVYKLTPEAFKKCLMRAQRRPEQKADPVVYCDYYLLLEKIYKLYTDYEKQLLNRQIEQNKQQLEQKEQIIVQKEQTIVQKDQQLEQKDKHLLRLNKMLVDSTKLSKTQVVYIATSRNYAQQNRFKVGGVEAEDKLSSRLASYNSRSAEGDLFYFSDWFLVHNYREIENRLKDLLGRFRDSKSKEIYILHYLNLQYVLDHLIKNFNEETDIVNEHLVKFISNLDNNKLRPVIPKPRCLTKIKIKEVGQPVVVIEGNTRSDIELKLEQYFLELNMNVEYVLQKMCLIN